MEGCSTGELCVSASVQSSILWASGGEQEQPASEVALGAGHIISDGSGEPGAAAGCRPLPGGLGDWGGGKTTSAGYQSICLSSAATSRELGPGFHWAQGVQLGQDAGNAVECDRPDGGQGLMELTPATDSPTCGIRSSSQLHAGTGVAGYAVDTSTIQGPGTAGDSAGSCASANLSGWLAFARGGHLDGYHTPRSPPPLQVCAPPAHSHHSVSGPRPASMPPTLSTAPLASAPLTSEAVPQQEPTPSQPAQDHLTNYPVNITHVAPLVLVAPSPSNPASATEHGLESGANPSQQVHLLVRLRARASHVPVLLAHDRGVRLSVRCQGGPVPMQAQQHTGGVANPPPAWAAQQQQLATQLAIQHAAAVARVAGSRGRDWGVSGTVSSLTPIISSPSSSASVSASSSHSTSASSSAVNLTAQAGSGPAASGPSTNVALRARRAAAYTSLAVSKAVAAAVAFDDVGCEAEGASSQPQQAAGMCESMWHLSLDISHLRLPTTLMLEVHASSALLDAHPVLLLDAASAVLSPELAELARPELRVPSRRHTRPASTSTSSRPAAGATSPTALAPYQGPTLTVYTSARAVAPPEILDVWAAGAGGRPSSAPAAQQGLEAGGVAALLPTAMRARRFLLDLGVWLEYVAEQEAMGLLAAATAMSAGGMSSSYRGSESKLEEAAMSVCSSGTGAATPSGNDLHVTGESTLAAQDRKDGGQGGPSSNGSSGSANGGADAGVAALEASPQAARQGRLYARTMAGANARGNACSNASAPAGGGLTSLQRAHAQCLGRHLLAHAVLAGWPVLASRMMHGLTGPACRECFAKLVIPVPAAVLASNGSARQGPPPYAGVTLFHLAVRSGRPAMLRVVVHWGTHFGMPWARAMRRAQPRVAPNLARPSPPVAHSKQRHTSHNARTAEEDEGEGEQGRAGEQEGRESHSYSELRRIAPTPAPSPNCTPTQPLQRPLCMSPAPEPHMEQPAPPSPVPASHQSPGTQAAVPLPPVSSPPARARASVPAAAPVVAAAAAAPAKGPAPAQEPVTLAPLPLAVDTPPTAPACTPHMRQARGASSRARNARRMQAPADSLAAAHSPNPVAPSAAPCTAEPPPPAPPLTPAGLGDELSQVTLLPDGKVLMQALGSEPGSSRTLRMMLEWEAVEHVRPLSSEAGSSCNCSEGPHSARSCAGVPALCTPGGEAGLGWQAVNEEELAGALAALPRVLPAARASASSTEELNLALAAASSSSWDGPGSQGGRVTVTLRHSLSGLTTLQPVDHTSDRAPLPAAPSSPSSQASVQAAPPAVVVAEAAASVAPGHVHTHNVQATSMPAVPSHGRDQQSEVDPWHVWDDDEGPQASTPSSGPCALLHCAPVDAPPSTTTPTTASMTASATTTMLATMQSQLDAPHLHVRGLAALQRCAVLLQVCLCGYSPPAREAAYVARVAGALAPVARLWAANVLLMIVLSIGRSIIFGVGMEELPALLVWVSPYAFVYWAAASKARAARWLEASFLLAGAGRALSCALMGLSVFAVPNAVTMVCSAHLEFLTEPFMYTALEQVRAPGVLALKALSTLGYTLLYVQLGVAAPALTAVLFHLVGVLVGVGLDAYGRAAFQRLERLTAVEEAGWLRAVEEGERDGMWLSGRRTTGVAPTSSSMGELAALVRRHRLVGDAPCSKTV